jgi:hypothetical protein
MSESLGLRNNLADFELKLYHDLFAKITQALKDKKSIDWRDFDEWAKRRGQLEIKNVKIDSLPERALAIGMPSDEFDKLLETYKGSGTYEQVKDYIKDDIRAIYMMAKGSK